MDVQERVDEFKKAISDALLKVREETPDNLEYRTDEVNAELHQRMDAVMEGVPEDSSEWADLKTHLDRAYEDWERTSRSVIERYHRGER